MAAIFALELLSAPDAVGISADISARTTAAIIPIFEKSGADEVRDAVKANIESGGVRTGTEYEDTQLPYLLYRKTSPGPQNGSLTSAQKSYIGKHLPIDDTGTLKNSFTKTRVVTKKRTIAVEITSTTDYGRSQELGIATGKKPSWWPTFAEAPKRIFARPHAGIIDSDAAAIDKAVEQGVPQGVYSGR